jgi:hypothetical protein
MPDVDDEELKRIQRDKVNGVRPTLGVVIAVVPFFVSYRDFRETTVTANEIRTVTHKTAFDYVAVPCGALAVVLGILGLVRGVSARKIPVAVVSGVCLALGLFQAVRGFLR